MSTRASLIYDQTNGVHIYEELLNGYVYLEIERADLELQIKLMPAAEWKKTMFSILGRSTNEH